MRGLVGPSWRMVFLARAIVGVGGSGGGIGLGPTWASPCQTADECKGEPFFWPPVTLEAHLERMYGPTPWRSATYVGPQVSCSAYVLKASVGWMVDASDRHDPDVQVGIGFGF